MIRPFSIKQTIIQMRTRTEQKIGLPSASQVKGLKARLSKLKDEPNSPSVLEYNLIQIVLGTT